jgi:hypothetical protein
VAAALALALGVPAARVEWRTFGGADARGSGAVRIAAEGAAEVAGLVLVAAALAGAGSAGWLAFVAALAAWPLAAALADRDWLAAACGAAALGLAALHALSTLTVPPWTLLAPQWAEWRAWMPAALLGGAWLAAVGTGRWPQETGRAGRGREVPFATVGAAVLVLGALAVEHGAAYEASLAARGGSALVLALVGAGAAAEWVRRARPRAGARWHRPLAGAALTALLAGPAAGARDVVVLSAAPWLCATALGLAAVAAPAGPDRAVAAGTAALFAVAALASGAPVPAAMGDALWLGFGVAAAFWFVATRVLLARRFA